MLNYFGKKQKAAFKKNLETVRYHQIRFFISLASKSPSAYDEIRNLNILVFYLVEGPFKVIEMPSLKCPKVCFNQDMINELKNVTKNFNGIQRLTCVCFDEIKVQSSLVFNKYTDELIGFIDCGDPDRNYSTFSDLDKLATISLLIMLGRFVLTSNLYLPILKHTVLHLSR